MANTGTFRSAINGFNRQDVMDYLESASQRYDVLKKERNELDRIRMEQLGRLKELEGVQEEAAAMKEQAALEVAEAMEQLQAKEAECESLRAALEAMTAERDAALAAPAEDPAAAEKLRSEVSALRARLAELEVGQADVVQKAAEYDSMRDRIATLELNASRRAADIEETARGEARAMIAQAELQARELTEKAQLQASAVTEKAQQDADALLLRAKEEEADFLRQRDENYRSFRTTLQGAAQETEAGVGLISDELHRLSDKLKGFIGSILDTSRRFETAETPAAPESCCEEEGAACCESSPEKTSDEETHQCHE